MEFGGTTVSVKEYDVVIVGGGGSGLRASLEISKSGQNVAVVSKVFPTRSHTVAAQGVLHVQLQVLIQMMTGDGICLIQSKVQII